MQNRITASTLFYTVAHTLPSPRADQTRSSIRAIPEARGSSPAVSSALAYQLKQGTGQVSPLTALRCQLVVRIAR